MNMIAVQPYSGKAHIRETLNEEVDSVDEYDVDVVGAVLDDHGLLWYVVSFNDDDGTTLGFTTSVRAWAQA